MCTQIIELFPMETFGEMSDLKQNELRRLFYRLGITAKYVGFDYLSYAIRLAVYQPERLFLVTKRLYPDVAKHFRTSWQTVERGMRFAINVMWCTQQEELRAITQCDIQKRPTIVQFIELIITSLYPNPAA